MAAYYSHFSVNAKVDIRVRAMDVPDQESLTKDNIPIKINAVIYFKVADASKAILAVENFLYATIQACADNNEKRCG